MPFASHNFKFVGLLFSRLIGYERNTGRYSHSENLSPLPLYPRDSSGPASFHAIVAQNNSNAIEHV